MQIDFHHAVTYVLSRFAGFDPYEASIVAYAAQYVDDAVRSSTINFKTGESYKPLVSAHKMIDVKNFDNLQNQSTWMSFHFLPGNDSLSYSDKQDNDYFSKIVCRPNSYIARDMVEECIRNRHMKNSLYRLGITMHVYADTWAHQGFMGIVNDSNRVEMLDDDLVDNSIIKDSNIHDSLKLNVKGFLKEVVSDKLSGVLDNVLPLGHIAVLTYPDRPYLRWRYKKISDKIPIIRNNPEEFLDAARNMYIALRRFKTEDTHKVKGLDKDKQEMLHKRFIEYNDKDEAKRHLRWIEEIKNGVFKFDEIKTRTSKFSDGNLSYDATNMESWEYMALGADFYHEEKKYTYDETFANSHWKNFNDALVDHHYYLTRILFPKYKLCIM